MEENITSGELIVRQLQLMNTTLEELKNNVLIVADEIGRLREQGKQSKEKELNKTHRDIL